LKTIKDRNILGSRKTKWHSAAPPYHLRIAIWSSVDGTTRGRTADLTQIPDRDSALMSDCQWPSSLYKVEVVGTPALGSTSLNHTQPCRHRRLDIKRRPKQPIVPPPLLFTPQNSKIVFAARWDLHNFPLANPTVGQAPLQSASIFLYSG
jgi:hypothetical protein